MIKENKIYNEDGIKFIKHVEDKKIDLILSDIPYGINKDLHINEISNYLDNRMSIENKIS